MESESDIDYYSSNVRAEKFIQDSIKDSIDPLRGHPAEGLGWQPDLVRGAGAGGTDVGMADVLATGALGPGLLEPTPSRHTNGPAPTPVTYRARTSALDRLWSHRLPADTMG